MLTPFEIIVFLIVLCLSIYFISELFVREETVQQTMRQIDETPIIIEIPPAPLVVKKPLASLKLKEIKEGTQLLERENNFKSSIIPLKYWRGEFMIKLEIGPHDNAETDVLLAVDSGSSTTIISGSTCKNCPPGEKYPLDEINPDNVTLLRYSSQTNHVVWRIDRIQFHDNTEIENVEIGVTHKIVLKKQDQYLFNVFGISPVYNSIENERGFWEQQDVYDKHMWAIVCNKLNARLYLGDWPESLKNIDSINLTTMQEFIDQIPVSYLVVQFPIVRGDVYINKKLAIKNAYLLLDTGYTECAMHSKWINKIKGGYHMRVVIREGENTENYYKCPGTKFVEPPEQLELAPNVLILGNIWMMNKVIGVDLDYNKIAIKDL